MMTKYIAIAALVLSLIGSGYIIRNQSQTIHDLESRIEDVEVSRLAEQSHFTNEIERQARLLQRELLLKDIENAAENDPDDGSLFRSNRLQRINSIK